MQDTRISIVVVGTLKSVYMAIMHTPAVFNMYGTGYGLSVCFRVLCLHNKASRVCIRLQPMGQVGRISCAYIYITQTMPCSCRTMPYNSHKHYDKALCHTARY